MSTSSDSVGRDSSRHQEPPDASDAGGMAEFAGETSGGDLDGLIHRADLDGLVRLVDASCASGDWAGLLRLRTTARFAVTTGRQLWPAATLAEYRLALWAPAEWAVQVLDEDSGRFTIGPLTEVIAAHHTFADIAAALSAGTPSDSSLGGPRLGFVAHERALRGERIDQSLLDQFGVPDVLEMPLALQPWEPEYCLATYTDDGVTADPPPRPAGPGVGPDPATAPTSSARRASAARSASLDEPPRDDSAPGPASHPVGGDPPRRNDSPKRHVAIRQATESLDTSSSNRHEEIREAAQTVEALGPIRHVENRRSAKTVDDPVVELAVRQLLETWTASSDGKAEVVCVEGTAADAVAALGVGHASLVPLSPAEALSWLAWAGSVGGAHGRRRGAAVGRFGAWWLLAGIGDALDEWPLTADEMGELAGELRWFWWDGGEPALGWELQLAVADPESGYAWAISAHDAA